LQEPDLYIANGTQLKALAATAALADGDIRPAIVLGAQELELPYPNLPLPLPWPALYDTLADLIARRAEALAALSAAGLPTMPERRRRERLDLDLTDPAVYEKMRKPVLRGAVLCVDISAAFSMALEQSLAKYGIATDWSDNAAGALQLCRERLVSVVLLNTATPGIEHYELCAALRAAGSGASVPEVVFLVAPPFHYDSERAKVAGAAGMLDKPMAQPQVKQVLQKLMRLPCT
jgi:CheY-like chemotaxis protein